ncbi:hypothetical protein ABK040_007850 [Willaertia magna]
MRSSKRLLFSLVQKPSMKKVSSSLLTKEVMIQNMCKNTNRFKYNYSQTSSEELRRLTDSTSNGRALLMGLLGLSVGVGIGYFLHDQVEELLGPKNKTTIEPSAVDQAFTQKKSLKEIFDEFADVNVRNELTGKSEKMMSLEAFINSLINARPNTPGWVAYPRRNGKLLVDSKRLQDDKLKLVFEYADTDKNGFISYDEYVLFTTIMTSSERKLRIAFECFDLDGNGNISLNEFKELIKANRIRSNKENNEIDWNNNGLMKHLFGSELNNNLSFNDFIKFIKDCKEALLRQEFLLHDIEGNGLISVESFSELMTKSVHFNSTKIPEFKRQLNLLKTNGYFAPTGRIDFETFKAFNDMSQHLDDIGIMIQLYTISGRGMKKDEFKRNLKRITKLSLNDKVIDLIYAIYDKNGDERL